MLTFMEPHDCYIAGQTLQTVLLRQTTIGVDSRDYDYFIHRNS